MIETLEQQNTLSVSAIKNGTVIDHIPQGQALRIIRLLSLLKKGFKIMVGMNLPSKRLGIKDLIKIENHLLTKDEANDIVVFAPPATINIIENFHVINKISTHVPETMKGIFVCTNPSCISLSEPIESLFYIKKESRTIKLTCHYCEKVFTRETLSETI